VFKHWLHRVPQEVFASPRQTGNLRNNKGMIAKMIVRIMGETPCLA
jgi:hypothetical protein